MFPRTSTGISPTWQSSKLNLPESQKENKHPSDLSNPPSTIPLKSLDEDYKVISRLGDGGFGVVRLAKYKHDRSLLLQLGKPFTLTDSRGEISCKLSPLVAIKTMNAKLPRLELYTRVKEVQFIQSMPSHVNLLHIYEVFIDTSHYCLHFSMECMDQSLYSLMKARGGKLFTAATVKSILEQLLAAINHIHNHGYFHRDIKPQNILVSSMLQYFGSTSAIPPVFQRQKYIVKLADYGLARHVENCKDFTSYISTRWYRAPEMLLRRKWHSTPVDIWAFGTVATELAKLSPLYPGANEVDQIWRIFRVLGNPAPPKCFNARAIPTGGFWVEGQVLAARCGYSFPEGSGVPIASVVPGCYPYLSDMIRMCLKWNPEARPMASILFNQPYFADMSKRSIETSLVPENPNTVSPQPCKSLFAGRQTLPLEAFDVSGVMPDFEVDMSSYGYIHSNNNKENISANAKKLDPQAFKNPRTANTDQLRQEVAAVSINAKQFKEVSSDESFSFSGSCASVTHAIA